MNTVGERLRQRRMARGLGLEAVTRATRLTRTVLEALEEDRLDDLPAPVYARGFLKIYAQFLEIDSDSMLDTYETQVGVRQTLQSDVEDPLPAPDYLRDSESRGRTLSPAAILLLAATAAIALLFTWSVSRKTKPTVARSELVAPAPATATGPAVHAPTPQRSSGLPPLPGRDSGLRR